MSAERDVCYLMNIRRGIDALDLHSGTVLWTSDIAQKPILLLKDTLVAQAETDERSDVLRLAFLNTESNGEPVMRADIPLPAGVRAAIDAGAGTSFLTSAWPTPEGLTVVWSYSNQIMRGADSKSAGGQEGSVTRGAAVVDLKTASVTLLPDDDIPVEPHRKLPPKLAQLEDTELLTGQLWQSGGIYAAVSKIREDGLTRSVLKRWKAESGDSLPDVTLFTGRFTVRYPSADYRHVLASRLSGATASTRKYDWMVFAVGTGERIADLQLDLPGARFFMSGSLIVYEVQAQAHLKDGVWTHEPPKMRAIDVRTGSECWVWPVHDTAYHGTVPSQTHEMD